MCNADGVEVTGKVEVDVFHGDHLGIATASRAPFHAKARTERGLTNANRGALANMVEAIAKAYGGSSLTFARWCRRDRGD